MSRADVARAEAERRMRELGRRMIADPLRWRRAIVLGYTAFYTVGLLSGALLAILWMR